MRFAIAVLVVALSFPATVGAAGRVPNAVDANVRWSLALDAQGRIVSLDPLKPDYLPEVTKRLEPLIRTWHFRPGQLNGVPAPTQTTLTAAIVIRHQQGDQYEVKVRSASTGATCVHLTPPRYPEKAVRFGESGGVVVRVRYDVGGHVIDVSPVQNANIQPKAGGPDLVRAAETALRKWVFKPETVSGYGIAGEVLVPICFSLVSPRNPGPAPGYGRCRWTLPGQNEALGDDQPVSLASVVHLDTDVAGQTL